MAATLTDIQGRTAPGGAAFAERWPVAVSASKSHHIVVVKPMLATYGAKNRNGFTRRPTEGSS
ncbi:MAG: hypothetical protein ABIP03_08425 [Aquihabitans sp.]